MANRCPHCQQKPCMGGKGPGSCMRGSKGKTVPTPRSENEQNVDEALKTHTSHWRKVGSITKDGKTLTSFTCVSCGVMKLVEGKSEPPNEVHKNRK